MTSYTYDTGNPARTQDPNLPKFRKNQEVVILAPIFRRRHGFVRLYDPDSGEYGVDVWNGEAYDALGFAPDELEAVNDQLPLWGESA